jgi:predicted  nucleic acid-binding Zn-ribbon protein
LRGYESVNRALESARNDPKLLAHAHDWHNKLIQDVGESLAQLQDSLDTLQDEINKILEKASGTKSDVMKARRRKDDEFAQFKDGASILSRLFPNIETAGTRKGDKMVRDLNNADGAVKHLERFVRSSLFSAGVAQEAWYAAHQG